jgi:signal peptidase I
MLQILKVTGNSLSPAFNEGDFVLAAKIPFIISGLRPGDVIVFHYPALGTLIKRIDYVSPGGDDLYVIGTQENSVDSRQFGPIKKRDVTGKVIWHIRKPGG